jgi:hypothetical protein
MPATRLRLSKFALVAAALGLATAVAACSSSNPSGAAGNTSSASRGRAARPQRGVAVPGARTISTGRRLGRLDELGTR